MAADKDLIKGINLMLKGQEEGFNILYSKTYNYVYGRAKMIMKDEEDALDLTQETFIQAYKHIHTLEDVNNIYAWLGGIVYRHGMKIFRKKRDLLVNEDAEGIFEDIVSEDKDFHPEENAELKATSNIIMSMIEELPELQKAAILAFYYDNMKIDDIAEVFECSSNTIKSRLNYAKKYLKDKVEAHEKAYAYKLHSLSPAVIILAFKSLLASEQYTMSAAVAQGVYNGACAAVGFAPAAIATAQAAVTSATTGGASSAATTTATTAASTVASSTATTVGAGVAKAGMALGTKIAIGLAIVATVGTLGLGGAYIANNGGFPELFGVEESEHDDEKEDNIDGSTANEDENDTEENSEETEIVAEAKGWNLQAGEYLGRSGENYTIEITNNYVGSDNYADNTFDIIVVNKLGTHQIETLEVQNIGFTNVDGQDVLHFGGTVIDALDGEENEWDIYISKSGTNDLLVHHYMTRGGETVELGVMGPRVLIPKDNQIIDRRADVDEASFTGADANGNTVAVDITEFSLDQYDEAQYIPVITFVDPRTNNTVTVECTTMAGYHGQYAFDIYGICSFYCYTDTSCIYESDNLQEEYRGWGYLYYDKNGDICLTYTNEDGDLVLSDVTCYRN